jgi:hypothetical protein
MVLTDSELALVECWLGYPVRFNALRVKSGIEVNGWKRTTEQRKLKNRRRGRHASTSGVLISARHSPDECVGRRFGLIEYFAYVVPQGSRSVREGALLVARVKLFKRESKRDGVPCVDPRNMRKEAFFIRAKDLGPVVGLAPVAVQGDGTKSARPNFWNRPQYVVFCGCI